MIDPQDPIKLELERAKNLADKSAKIDRHKVYGRIVDKHFDAVIAALQSAAAQPSAQTAGYKAAFETSVGHLGNVNQTERELRKLLCVVYAGGHAYMDDGEAQDSRAHPCIDFLRDTPAVIQQKIQQRSLVAYDRKNGIKTTAQES